MIVFEVIDLLLFSSEIRNRRQQLEAMRRVIQLLPQVTIHHWHQDHHHHHHHCHHHCHHRPHHHHHHCLAQVNRDTLYVLLNFLHLVAINSEDRKGPQASISTVTRWERIIDITQNRSEVIFIFSTILTFFRVRTCRGTRWTRTTWPPFSHQIFSIQ